MDNYKTKLYFRLAYYLFLIQIDCMKNNSATQEASKAQRAMYVLYMAMGLFIILPFILLWVYGK